MELVELLAYAVKQRAGELVLGANAPIEVRIGEERRVLNLPPPDAPALWDMAIEALNPMGRENLKSVGQAQSDLDIPGLGQFRVRVEQHGARMVIVPKAAPAHGAPGAVPGAFERLRGWLGRKP